MTLSSSNYIIRCSEWNISDGHFRFREFRRLRFMWFFLFLFKFKICVNEENAEKGITKIVSANQSVNVCTTSEHL